MVTILEYLLEGLPEEHEVYSVYLWKEFHFRWLHLWELTCNVLSGLKMEGTVGPSGSPFSAEGSSQGQLSSCHRGQRDALTVCGL